MAGFSCTDDFARQAEMLQSPASDEEIAYQLQMLYLPRDSLPQFTGPSFSQQACASSSTRNGEARYPGSFDLGVTDAEQDFLEVLGIKLNPTIRESKCGLCMRVRPVTEFMSTKDCAHEYCTKCCKEHAERKILSKSSEIECPHPNCRHNFDNDQCYTLLSAANLDILHSRQVETAFAPWERIYCPFPDCFAFVPVLKPESNNFASDTIFKCNSCKRDFCLECNVPWERECNICAEMKPHKSFISTKDCVHEYCTECCERHAEQKILSGSLQIECPEPNCRHNFDIEQLSTLLSPPNFDILNTRLTEAAIPASQKVYCPFQDCSVMMEKPEGNNYARNTPVECFSCNRGFCLECNSPWHTDKTCGEYRADIENAKQNGDQKLVDLAKKNKWRECPNPNCKLMVERTVGCNHITCRCGHEWCYRDGRPWINKKATCSCPLYDRAP